MKILYAIQGTGNGHLSRAESIIPLLQTYGEVDILVSGTQAEVRLAQTIKYQLYGLSFIFGKSGGVDLIKTFQKTKILKLLKEILRLKVAQYDLIINDFEPISAWACLLRGRKCISLSHQSAVAHNNSPKPAKHSVIGSLILKFYAPCQKHYGFHFQPYAENIYFPVIRDGIRKLKMTCIPTKKIHYTVYLPAYSEERIINVLSEIPVNWEVFSKHSKLEKVVNNIKIYPINSQKFTDSLWAAEGLLCGAGFEGPAEALFLEKKLLVIPMKGQYEQQCNAATLSSMGVPVLKSLKRKHKSEIKKFINRTDFPTFYFPDQTADIIKTIIESEVSNQSQATASSLVGSV
jgi:uncharacterized protein (TIGR00661 family)